MIDIFHIKLEKKQKERDDDDDIYIYIYIYTYIKKEEEEEETYILNDTFRNAFRDCERKSFLKIF